VPTAGPGESIVRPGLVSTHDNPGLDAPVTVLLDMVVPALCFGAIAHALAITLLADQHLRHPDRPFSWRAANTLVYGGAAAGTWLATGAPRTIGLLLVAALLTAAVIRRPLASFWPAGRLLFVTHFQMLVAAVVWGVWFVLTVPVGGVTRGLMLAALTLVPLGLVNGLLRVLEGSEVLCRRRWRRPRSPLAPGPRATYPKVSLHVPAHAEPPGEVIATLDALARLAYPNFEVLVIDNNTADPALWRPVEEHCHRLGNRFRFFHLEDWPGAKAGALNFALGQVAPDTEIVSVIDADYHADPEFLASLIGYFDDPRLGFVQTPHAYRGWEGSLYQRMCNWEYSIFFATTLRSRNERMAAITVGTMCMIRRRALEEAGGWAEWCVTEDSELAPRIHALGYTSIYVNAVFGRGLIPDTFAGYKKQRFRWTFGPVQELKRHFRLFLPRRWATPSALRPAQKVHHMSHGLDHVATGLGFLLAPLGLVAAALMVLQREVIHVPGPVWVAMTVALPARWLLQWVAYRTAVGCSFGDMIGALIASHALGHTLSVASVRAMCTERIPWVRTSKFKALPVGLAVLGAARTELAIGLAMSGSAAALLVLAGPTGLTSMLLLTALFQGSTYFAAPALALLAEREVRSGTPGAGAGVKPSPPALTADEPRPAQVKAA
jgi:cellulose synthase/poly-beta-1,6-N-acetylglucosamine synthase-like glycosyltransferase